MTTFVAESPPAHRPTRIVRRRIRNFRVLRAIELAEPAPLTAFLGPNGSGKSTVLDVLAFLRDVASNGRENAWWQAGRMANIRSHGATGPVEVDLTYHDDASAGRPVRYLDTGQLPDDRLLLWLRESGFNEPVAARFISDGTLKLLAYLILLRDRRAPGVIGIEEPENLLHPRLIAGLADEMRMAAERSQLLVTSHAPYLVDALRPDDVWVFRGDPLTRSGRPRGAADG